MNIEAPGQRYKCGNQVCQWKFSKTRLSECKEYSLCTEDMCKVVNECPYKTETDVKCMQWDCSTEPVPPEPEAGVVGGIIGGILGLLIVCICIYMLIRRARAQPAIPSSIRCVISIN